MVLPRPVVAGPARDRAPESADGACDATVRKGQSLLVDVDLNSWGGGTLKTERLS